MSKKPKATKTVKVKVGSVSDFAIVLTQKDGAKLTFRAGQIDVVAVQIEGSRVYSNSIYFDVKEPAEVVNAMVDGCYKATAQGYYEATQPQRAPANRHEKRAAAKKAA